MTRISYTLDWAGTNCPVQAEGTFQGKHFYFRSRGNRWTFYIGNHHSFDNPEWTYSEEYGDEPYDAGWLTKDEALGFIEKSLRLFINL